MERSELPKPLGGGASGHRGPLERQTVLRPFQAFAKEAELVPRTSIRVAAYCRQSVAGNLEFSSVDAQRLAIASYTQSQAGAGWILLEEPYDDEGFSGGNTNRPAYQRLTQDVEAGKVDVVAVYSIDRLSRSIADFAQVVQFFDRHGVSFVSVTQAFDTSTPHGQLTLNVLMSFAQFERQMISQRTRDKMAATRRRGQYTGGKPVLGYRLAEKKLVVDHPEADRVRETYGLFLDLRCVAHLTAELNRRGWKTKPYKAKNGRDSGGNEFDRGTVRRILRNPIYIGRVFYGGELHEGAHDAIVDEQCWQRVQAILDDQYRPHRPHRQCHAPLRGILYCSRCDQPFEAVHTLKGNRRYDYYQCVTRKKRDAKACPHGRVPAQKIDRFVVAELCRIGQDPELTSEVTQSLRNPSSEKALCRILGRFEFLWSTTDHDKRSSLLRLLIKRVKLDGESGELEIFFCQKGIAAFEESAP